MLVLDANILIRDFRFSSNAFVELKDRAGDSHLTVGVPEVAIREATRKLGRMLEAQQARTTKELESLRKLRGPAVDLVLDIPAIVDDYESELRNQCDEVGWMLLPLPSLGHAEVLAAIHSGKPPANGDGKGYQDVLVWQTLLDALPSFSHVVLVSDDSDFSEGEELHPDLTAEAVAIRGDCLVGLKKALKLAMADFDPGIAEDEFFSDFDRGRRVELEHALGDRLVGFALPSALRDDLAPWSSDGWISGVADMSDVELHDIRPLPDGQIGFDVFADVATLTELQTEVNAQGPVFDQFDVGLLVSAEGRWDPSVNKFTHFTIVEMRYIG